jgi:DNA primase
MEREVYQVPPFSILKIMISTKNLILNGSEVPSTWVFEFYLDLPERLNGQNVQIKSVFHPSERTPSMWIFVDKGQYKFKDFSTGKGGNKIDLIKELFGMNYSQAVFKIGQDYNKFITEKGEYSQSTIKPEAKYKVDSIKTRDWNEHDKRFWLQFNIGEDILKRYDVKPLEFYHMVKENNKITIKQPYMYGYFSKNDIYKIYQPRNKKFKFIKVKPHLQGLDQLEYNQPYLIICSSLKDAMCLKQFGYNIEVIAPDSENTIIKPYIIENLKKKYKKVVTLFDNDVAGHNAVHKYEKLYDIKGTWLDSSKDIADLVKEKGFDDAHKEIKVKLKSIL